MKPDRHWWRTRDGRLVPDGDPEAAILAYPRGHEVPDHLAEQIGLAAVVRDHAGESGTDESAHDEGDEPEAKQSAKQVDKMATRPANKGSRPARRAGEA